MKIKTSELIGRALDWAVALCAKKRPISHYASSRLWWSPSTCWAHGGPLIEREGLYLKARNDAKEWKAGALSMNRQDNKPGPLYSGPTPLIAAMRCYVASKLGDEVDVPEELV